MSRYPLLLLFTLTASAYAGPPDISRVNGSLAVDSGQSVGDASTVNGGIQVGEHATVGNVRTVNGSITLGAGSVAQSLRSVNGRISVGADAHLNGGVSTTNGTISIGPETRVSGGLAATNGTIVLAASTDISGHVRTVNGSIHLNAAHVSLGIETVSGAIDVGSHSKVEGGIWVRQPDGWTSCGPGLLGKLVSWLSLSSCEPQLIVIGPDATVQGTLRFDHPVRLFVNTSAQVGPVQGAKPIPFSGERPPV